MNAPELVTFDEAKRHLRITDDDHDEDIEATRLQANDLVFGYLKSQGDPTWTALTVPPEIKRGVLVMIAYYYEHRGDDLTSADSDAAIWSALGNIVKRRRDPALA